MIKDERIKEEAKSKGGNRWKRLCSSWRLNDAFEAIMALFSISEDVVVVTGGTNLPLYQQVPSLMPWTLP